MGESKEQEQDCTQTKPERSNTPEEYAKRLKSYEEKQRRYDRG